MERELAYGLNEVVPVTAVTAWGARLIFPDDLLSDRQDFVNPNSTEGQTLLNWLNSQGERKGALSKALSNARDMAKIGAVLKNEDRVVTLYEDLHGIIQANPRSSCGYLYVAAYLKEV